MAYPTIVSATPVTVAATQRPTLFSNIVCQPNDYLIAVVHQGSSGSGTLQEPSGTWSPLQIQAGAFNQSWMFGKVATGTTDSFSLNFSWFAPGPWSGILYVIRGMDMLTSSSRAGSFAAPTTSFSLNTSREALWLQFLVGTSATGAPSGYGNLIKTNSPFLNAASKTATQPNEPQLNWVGPNANNFASFGVALYPVMPVLEVPTSYTVGANQTLSIELRTNISCFYTLDAPSGLFTANGAYVVFAGAPPGDYPCKVTLTAPGSGNVVEATIAVTVLNAPTRRRLRFGGFIQ